MSNLNFVGFEARVRQMIITLMEGPIAQINGYDTIIQKINELLQRNIRRTHELEFIM